MKKTAERAATINAITVGCLNPCSNNQILEPQLSSTKLLKGESAELWSKAQTTSFLNQQVATATYY